MNEDALGEGLGHALLAGATHFMVAGVCAATPLAVYWARHPTANSADDVSRAWGIVFTVLWAATSAAGALLVSGAFVLGFGCPHRRSTVALAALSGVGSTIVFGSAWRSLTQRAGFTEVALLGLASGIALTLVLQVAREEMS